MVKLGRILACVVLVSSVLLSACLGQGDTIITLENGASISIPPGAISRDATVTATQLDPENGPETPEGFTIETLYEFSVDEPLMEPVTLRLPLSSVTEDSVLWLAKYDETEGAWHGVGFTIQDGYAVVQTDTLSIFGTIRGTWDDFTNWATKNVGSVAWWARDEILPSLTLDHWISWLEEISGLDEMIYEPLFATSPQLEYDDSAARGLIAASAKVIDEHSIEIRIRNDTKMYLHLYFDGASVEPIKRGYIAAADVMVLVLTTPGMSLLVEQSFLSQSVILLPECTADFRAYMGEGDSLQIKAQFSDAAALFNSLDPFFALVPIADVEVIAAVRDVKGAESEFYDALVAYEGEWLIKTCYGLDLVAETLRAGWLLGTEGLKFIANIALWGVPAVTELADKSLERVEDIVDKGSDAIWGGTLVISYVETIPPGQYELMVSSTAGGSVTTPGEGTFSYDGGSVVNLVAAPAGGYQFVNWTGDVDTIGNVNAAITTITMNGDYSITANFEEHTAIIRPGGRLAAGDRNTIGLKSDGTAVAVGDNWWGQCDVGDWTDIIQVAAGYIHTVGLKSDGRVVALGNNWYGQCDVSGWTDIVQVAAGEWHTVGVKSDGTVIAVGRNDYGQCDVGGLTNITQLAAGWGHTVGLKANGAVVAVGWNDYGQCNVGGWAGITQVGAGNAHTIGLKIDGTVVAVGWNGYGQCDVGGWVDITQVAGGHGHTLGLRSDGTVVTAGSNGSGQCDVGDWTDIVQVTAGLFHTVGLKANGTVVAVGRNESGQCDVGDWMLG